MTIVIQMLLVQIQLGHIHVNVTPDLKALEKFVIVCGDIVVFSYARKYVSLTIINTICNSFQKMCNSHDNPLFNLFYLFAYMLKKISYNINSSEPQK